MIWNRPPQSQLDKYHKGMKIEDMFSSTASKRETYRFEDIENITQAHLSGNYMLCLMIKGEMKCEKEKEKRSNEKKEEEERMKLILEKVYSMQVEKDVKAFSVMEPAVSEDNALNLKTVSRKENVFYQKNVVVDKNKLIKIALKSAEQSQSSIWYKERFIRITASSRAHKVKTRKENFEGLAATFFKEKYKISSTPEMRYGLRMEREAKLKFQEMTNYFIYDVGLIVSSKQPYLACSADGLIRKDNILELLEVKCPYTCESSAIVDRENKILYVKYLKFNKNNEIVLHENHIYYTQVQTSMHVLCVDTCHFFVYSPFDQVHIVVKKNEEFLSNLITKIEEFYFNNFIQLLEK